MTSLSRFGIRSLTSLFVALQFLPGVSQDSDLLPREFFAGRRTAFLEQMPDSSVAVFRSAPLRRGSGDVNYEYRQDSNFYYLTGITYPRTTLLLSKSGPDGSSQRFEEILFVSNPIRQGRDWEDENLTLSKAKAQGFRDVRVNRDFRDELARILETTKLLFHSFKPDFFHEHVSGERFFVGQKAKKTLRERYPGLEFESPRKILARLRQVKTSREIGLLRKAITITCEALNEAMRVAEPGIFEYELEAKIEYIFKRRGSEGPAFPSIIGSGPNSTVLHYSRNRRKAASGELIVVDIGAEYHGYSADVTRTIPVAGQFSREQREIYQIVLQAQREAIAAVKPGVSVGRIHEIAKGVIAGHGYGAYFHHATTHFVGLDTHDVGELATLEAGMVLTVEPGIYIPAGSAVARSYWDIGVRIEDDILVTADGYEVLSTETPKEIEGIVRLMNKTATTLDYK
jgi:Xaa-Pro aminopeptidase